MRVTPMTPLVNAGPEKQKPDDPRRAIIYRAGGGWTRGHPRSVAALGALLLAESAPRSFTPRFLGVERDWRLPDRRRRRPVRRVPVDHAVLATLRDYWVSGRADDVFDLLGGKHRGAAGSAVGGCGRAHAASPRGIAGRDCAWNCDLARTGLITPEIGKALLGVDQPSGGSLY